MDKLSALSAIFYPNCEYIEEMSTVGRDLDNNFMIAVNPDKRRSCCYFKYYNHKNYERATKVIRLDFKSVKYYDHIHDGKRLWGINRQDKANLMKFLKAKPKTNIDKRFNSNWEMCIYLWNKECEFTDDKDWDESFPEGCNPKSELFKNPQFVPLNSPIPDYTKLRF